MLKWLSAAFANVAARPCRIRQRDRGVFSLDVRASTEVGVIHVACVDFAALQTIRSYLIDAGHQYENSIVLRTMGVYLSTYSDIRFEYRVVVRVV